MSAPVGVVIVGHGDTASRLLAAAHGIVRSGLEEVRAIDAGAGETPALRDRLCATIESVDGGRGVVVMVDLVGASPCECAKRQGVGHDVVVLSGLNLAMLLKLAAVDRTQLSVDAVAQSCADTAVRSVTVTVRPRDSAIGCPEGVQ